MDEIKTTKQYCTDYLKFYETASEDAKNQINNKNSAQSLNISKKGSLSVHKEKHDNTKISYSKVPNSKNEEHQLNQKDYEQIYKTLKTFVQAKHENYEIKWKKEGQQIRFWTIGKICEDGWTSKYTIKMYFNPSWAVVSIKWKVKFELFKELLKWMQNLNFCFSFMKIKKNWVWINIGSYLNWLQLNLFKIYVIRFTCKKYVFYILLDCI